MHNLKRNDTNELTKKRLTDLENELMVARQKSGRSDSYGVWDGHVHTAVFNNKDLLYSTGNSAQCYMAAWMGGEFGGGWIHAHAWLSSFAAHLKLLISQHC